MPLALDESRSLDQAFMLCGQCSQHGLSVIPGLLLYVLHESVVDRDNKHLSSILELVACNVAGNVLLGARGREGRRDTDDDAFARGQLLREVDLVAG